MPEVVDLERLVVELSADLQKYVRAMDRAQQVTDRRTAAIEKQFETMNRNIGRSSDRMARDLRRAIAAAGVGIIAREAAQAADSWTRYENLVRAAGIAQNQTNAVMDQNVGIARRSRSELGSTIELYSRILRSTRELGLAQADVARATEIVNKAFVAGGASGSERAAATLQLSQGLASGFLQGDELRSIRENAPLLAQAIANEFGTTIGDLKRLGAEGQLTTDRLVRAILNGGEAIEAQFASTRATVEDSFTALRTETARYIASFDDAVGASEGLSAAITAVADNMELVGDAAIVVAATVGGLLAGRAMVALVGQLSAAVLGLQAATVAMTTVTGASRAATGAMIALRGGMAFLGGPWVVAITAIATALGVMITASRRADERIAELNAEFEALESTLSRTEQFLDEGARSLQSFGDEADVAADRVADLRNALDDLPDNADPLFRRLAAQVEVSADRSAAQRALEQLESERDRELIRLEALAGSLTPVGASVPGFSDSLGSPRLDRLNAQIAEEAARIEQATARLEDLANAPIDNFASPATTANIERLREELEGLRAGSQSAAAQLQELQKELATIEGGAAGGTLDQESKLRAAILRVRIEALEKPARDALTEDREKIAQTLDDLRTEIDRFGDEQAQFVANFVDRLPDTATQEDVSAVERLAAQLFTAQREAQLREEAASRRQEAAQSRRAIIESALPESALLEARRAALKADRDVQGEQLRQEFDRLQQSGGLDQAHEVLNELIALLQETALATQIVDNQIAAARQIERRQALLGSDDPKLRAKGALEEIAATAGNTADVIEGSITRAFQGAEDAISEFVRTGKLSFKSLVASIIADIAVLAARSAILGPIATAIGSRFALPAGVLHTGGMAGSGPKRAVPALAFAGAPRLHGGGGFGLRPDEHPAILQTGERVLNRSETQAYQRGAGGAVVNVSIMTPNPSAFHASRVQVAGELARAVSFAMRGA